MDDSPGESGDLKPDENLFKDVKYFVSGQLNEKVRGLPRDCG